MLDDHAKKEALSFTCLRHLCQIAAILLLSSCVSGNQFIDLISQNRRVEVRKQLPALELRGYGRIEGEYVLIDDAQGRQVSLLNVDCEDQDKASLFQAKYASALETLGEVKQETLPFDGTAIPYFAVKSQGAVLCIRDGKRVVILTAKDKQTLTAMAKPALSGKLKMLAFSSDREIPAYLDSWDQHAFRFYYRPWEMPKDKAKAKTYNILTEFDYAKKHGDLGLVFWAPENKMDFAGGLNNDLWWDWAARAAERRQLPVVINCMNGPSTWLLNQYRDQTRVKMPQYCGSYHSVADPYHGGEGAMSWCATTGKDAEFALLQKTVKKYAAKANVLEFLEPHGELDHGAYNIFLEYGPLADRSYRKYLKEKYGNLGRISQRWYGNPNQLKSWQDVHVPEIASFLGWNADAVDLSGTWRMAYNDEGFSSQWFEESFDDSQWPLVVAPGHDRTMLLKKKPAVYRRRFSIDKAWLDSQKQVWLYIWDLNYGKHKKEKISAYVNGKKAGDSLTLHARPHWCAFNIKTLLRPGENQLSLQLLQGYLAYRVYLSPNPPKQYPDLGREKNAQWVDFCDWKQWTRLDMVRRGMEMIRQVDADRSIICMAPDGYVAGIKELCEDYGAHFHNTGHMGGFWNDYLPALMRGSNLPFSLEPGGPASDLPGFKRMMAYYLTEGINAIHYFIHIGSIIWNDQIRAHFEKILPMLKALGRIHPPKAEIAFLHSNRIQTLCSYPWGKDPNTNLPSG